MRRAGILLDRADPFNHGMLYVALSRVKKADDLRVCISRKDRRVKNVVFKPIIDEEDLKEASRCKPPTDDDLVCFLIR